MTTAGNKPSWEKLHLRGDPIFLCAKKVANQIEARTINLEQPAYPPLHGIATRALKILTDAEERPYAPTGHLEKNEQYYLILADELPPPPTTARQSVPDPADEAPEVEENLAALLQELGRIGDLDPLRPEEFGDMDKLLLYGISYDTSQGRITFIRRLDPMRLLRRPHFFFKRYGDALRNLEEPDIVLDQDVDVIVHDGKIAVLNRAAFDSLFFDVRLVLQKVSTYADKVSTALKSSIPVSANAKTALVDVAQAKVSYAKRLHGLPDRLSKIVLTIPNVKKALKAHNIPMSTLIGKNNEFEFDSDGVGTFLDLVEGRLFKDDFSTEQRRADRFSSLK